MKLFKSGLFGSRMAIIAAFQVVAAVGSVDAQAQPATSQPAAVAYTQPSKPAVLGTTFVAWDSMAVRETATGQSRAVFDNPTSTLPKFEMHLTTLKGGMMSHPAHRHPWEEMLIVKEGELEETINGKPHRAGPGSIIFLASNDLHSVRNAGETPATYYVVNFCTDLIHSVSDKPAAEQAVPGRLPSGILDCDHMPATATPTGSSTPVVDSPTLTFLTFHSHITMLNPGASTKSDMVDSGDELFILKTGTLEATVNGVSVRLKEGSFFYIAPNEKRTFKNIGTTPASYLVLKIVSAKTPGRAGN